jgi:lipoate-protein ligase A
MPECRLILDPLGGGAWNMAVDEVLLENGGRDGSWTLRFYGWSEPTLSLGYFQTSESRRCHAASQGCPVVRRQSGGGAIVHDRELTYALVVPARHALARESQRLYRAVHGAIVQELASVGVTARMYDPEVDTERTRSAEEPFLCFERRAVGDIVVGEAKIGGSAQRRRWGAVLQHGSLLIARSNAAPELPGIEELGCGQCSWEAWRSRFSDALLGALELSPRLASLSESIRAEAAILAEHKYGAASWNKRR